MYLVISTSLNPNSRSRILGRVVLERLEALGAEVTWVDLQELPLPLCDAGACYADPNVQTLGQMITDARAVVLAVPVYNYDVSAAAKNIVELTGKAWTEKVVGLVCAAGGHVSYMAPMGLANSLMLDFRSFVVPRFVFATGKAFDENNQLVDEKIRQRLDEVARSVYRVAEALAG